MKLTRLLRGPAVTKLNFEIDPEKLYSEEKKHLEIEYSLTPVFNKKEKKVNVFFITTITSEDAKINIQLQTFTLFSYEGKPASDKETQGETMANLALPYIFPVVREWIADMTRKAHIQPLYLPGYQNEAQNLIPSEKTGT